MKSQAEIVEELKAAKTALGAANDRVTKIGTETDALSEKIVALQALIDEGGAITPELEAAAKDVTDGIAALQTTIGTVDDKVPDAEPAP